MEDLALYTDISEEDLEDVRQKLAAIKEKMVVLGYDDRRIEEIKVVREERRQATEEQADRLSRIAQNQAEEESKGRLDELRKASEGAKFVPSAVTTLPKGRVNSMGLVNGRGATNGTGLINGRGAINGTGLINGTGMINGTRAGDKIASRSPRRKASIKRWQFMAFLFALIVILPSLVFLSFNNESNSGTSVDGDFTDWAGVAKFGMETPLDLPRLSVQEWAVKSLGTQLYLYLNTESDLMSTSDVDSFFLFVDSDDDPSTGYSASGLGADYMLELHGWDKKVESSAVSTYESPIDQYNWTAWSRVGSLSTALQSDELEAGANMPGTIGRDARFMLLAQGNLPGRISSFSYTVPETGGALIVRLESGPGIDNATGTVSASSSVSLLRLVLSCEGKGGTVHRISPLVSGAVLVAPVTDVVLNPGEKKTADVFVDSSACNQSDLVTATVLEAYVNSTFSDVVIVGEGVRAYVSSAPVSIRIDGAFGDWAGRISPDGDLQTPGNPDINITAAGCAETGPDAAFYVSVQGEIFHGAFAPTVKSKPSVLGGGDIVVPARKTGEDILRMYIDSDCSESTGWVVSSANKTIGADYAIEILGMNGGIVSKSILRAFGTEWIEVTSEFPVSKDAQQMELSVPLSSIGGSPAIRLVVETTDWRHGSDRAWAGDPIDPWAITSSGEIYASFTGASWTFLGAPSLIPGDSVVDVATNPAGDIVYAVTNSGRTYQWIIGASSSWSSSLTNPIGGTANVAAIAVYSDTGAFILTQDGRPFYDSNLTSTSTWTARAVIPKGHADYVDLVWRSGNTYSTANLYAMRSETNSKIWFTQNGGSTNFVEKGAVSGTTTRQTMLAVIPGGRTGQDQLFILQENGVIRYSSGGGKTWSDRGNLPLPGAGNSSIYVGISIDAVSNIWVVTNTGYCYRSSDNGITFTYMGQTPAAPIIGFTTPIPEFSMTPLAVMVLLTAIFLIARTRRRGAQ